MPLFLTYSFSFLLFFLFNIRLEGNYQAEVGRGRGDSCKGMLSSQGSWSRQRLGLSRVCFKLKVARGGGWWSRYWTWVQKQWSRWSRDLMLLEVDHFEEQGMRREVTSRHKARGRKPPRGARYTYTFFFFNFSLFLCLSLWKAVLLSFLFSPSTHGSRILIWGQNWTEAHLLPCFFLCLLYLTKSFSLPLLFFLFLFLKE